MLRVSPVVFRSVLLPLASLLMILPFRAQAETIVTESGHFRVHYGSGAAETAREVAVIAEQVYYQLVTAYRLHEEFRPIDIIVTDNIDMGNGMADYYQNQAVIWSTNMDYQLRGSHRWLRNVVAHELAHVFSLKLAQRYPFRYGLINASVVNSGLADFGVTLPIYSLVAPAWWVEGIAQYESEVFGWEGWDTHRDMLLRMATLEDDLLSYSDMGVFEHNWLKNEMVYNQGYGLVRYIAEHRGRESVRELAGNTGFVSFGSALHSVLDISGSDLYDAWTTSLRSRYGSVRDSVGTVREGSVLADNGSFEWSPVISPDGSQVAFITNYGEDYLLTQPRIMHLTSGSTLEIDKRAYGRITWFPTGDKVVYTRFGRGTMFNDLYVYDITTREEHRITSQLRAHDPAVSPDGQWIAFVATEDGGTRLGMVKADGSEVRWLSNDRRSTSENTPLSKKTRSFIQFHTPRWSPDGTKLVFSVFCDNDRDIATVGTQGPYFTLTGALEDSAAFPDSLVFPDEAGFRLLLHTGADERDPVWLPNGSGILYAADYNGIFNIYQCEIPSEEDGEPTTAVKLTNVIGGAFSPDMSADGRWITYAGYHANNFSIYTLPLDTSASGSGGSIAVSEAGLDRAYRGGGDLVALEHREGRDYQTIAERPAAEQLFRVGHTRGMRTLVGWVPSLRFGPQFIGDDFSMNHVGGSVGVGIEDQTNGRYYYGHLGLNKKLNSDDPVSTEAVLYAEQNLVPLMTTGSGLRPTLHLFGSRATTSVSNTSNEWLFFLLPEVNDDEGNPIPLSPESFVVMADSQRTWDDYQYATLAAGVSGGLGQHRFGGEVSYVDYLRNLNVDRGVYNYSQLIDERDGSDVSNQFDWAQYNYPRANGKPMIWDNTPWIHDHYFKDRALTLYWSWGKYTPAVDNRVNPASGPWYIVFLHVPRQYRDRLAGATVVHHLGGLDSRAGTGTADVLLRDSTGDIRVNELRLHYREHLRLPGFLRRTTLTLQGTLGLHGQTAQILR